MSKSYEQIRFEIIQDHLNSYRTLSTEEQQEIADGVKDIMDTVISATNNIKKLISDYFSDEVQRDETPSGAMRRNQLRKELLDFAHR